MNRAVLTPSQTYDDRRAERKVMRVKAQLREFGAGKFDIDIIDLSITGFRIETAYQLQPGALVWLTVPGLAALEAQVMWRDAFRFGCAFTGPLHHAVFDHLVKRFDRP